MVQTYESARRGREALYIPGGQGQVYLMVIADGATHVEGHQLSDYGLC